MRSNYLAYANDLLLVWNLILYFLKSGIQLSPARLTDNPSKPGAYFYCSNTTIFKPNANSYLVQNPKLKWATVNYGNLTTVRILIKLNASDRTIYYAKFLDDTWRMGRVECLNGGNCSELIN